ncbi:MAG: rRNA maturation RNase YbeY [Patescibacteria group bacterium]
MLVEINNQTKKRINLVLVKKIAELFLRSYHLNNQEISLAFVNNQTIKRLNRIYRGLNKITDVLAFSDTDKNNFLNEIIINYEQIKKQAKQFNHSAQQELIFILVHGLLHLAGYDDTTDKGAMNMNKLANKFINLNKLTSQQIN